MKALGLKAFDITVSIFKILLAISMMVNGVATIVIGPSEAVTGAVAFVYSSHIILALFGIYFFIAGALLLYGKIRKHRRLVGWGLMMTYLSYLFATILQYLAGLDWITNLVMTFIVALLYLRWKYQKFYSKPIS